MNAIVVTKYIPGASTGRIHPLILVCFCYDLSYDIRKHSTLFVLYGIYYKCIICHTLKTREESDTIIETDQVFNYIEI